MKDIELNNQVKPLPLEGITEPTGLRPPLRDWYWLDKIHEQLALS